MKSTNSSVQFLLCSHFVSPQIQSEIENWRENHRWWSARIPKEERSLKLLCSYISRRGRAGGRWWHAPLWNEWRSTVSTTVWTPFEILPHFWPSPKIRAYGNFADRRRIRSPPTTPMHLLLWIFKLAQDWSCGIVLGRQVEGKVLDPLTNLRLWNCSLVLDSELMYLNSRSCVGPDSAEQLLWRFTRYFNKYHPVDADGQTNLF